MRYQIEKTDNRKMFVFNKPVKTFEEVEKIIEDNIKPDFKSEIEITSWTIAFMFSKNGVKIYFENFYLGYDSFTFELFPIGRDNELEFIKLKEIIDDLKEFI